MQNLNEAVIKLINEDVIGGKKLIENELYERLGTMLEEKLKDFAPTVFAESKSESKPDYLDLDKDGNTKEPMKKAVKERGKPMNESDEQDEDLILEEYEMLVNELEQLVEEIEQETGEELTEGEIEELADFLLEELESEVDPDEEEESEEDFEDSDEDYEE